MKSPSINRSRKERLQDLASNSRTRILIVGGGIHAASFARIAALNGVDCILLEKQDYASGTSSRSTKLAHGGLRYLETFDFQQVLEGIKAREDLFETASHACRPIEFLIPVKKNDWWFRLKLSIGLFVYDLMCKAKDRKHKWIPRSALRYEGFHSGRSDLMGCYSYCDGLMNDAHLVIEAIVHAQALGARCMNYMPVTNVRKNLDNTFTVEAKEEFSGSAYTFTADLVINCAGPWVPFIGHKESERLRPKLRYSAGVNMLFSRPWNQPALFLPMEQKTRYYFVTPHPTGTLVGTTEREVKDVPFEQYPLKSEVEEILKRLEKDLPDARLNRETLHYAFAGVRTLPLRGNNNETATLSRKHIWENVEGVLTLLGGKWTTAAWTSFEGFQKACKLLGVDDTNMRSLQGVRYPGKGTIEELVRYQEALEEKGISRDTAKRIVSRLGIRTSYLLEDVKRLELISKNLTRGEIELAIEQEHAVTVEDFLRRRTEIELLPGNGLEELQAVKHMILESHIGSIGKDDVQMYIERINFLQAVMHAK